MRRRIAQDQSATLASPQSGVPTPVLVYEAILHDRLADETYCKFPSPGWLEDWIALRRRFLTPANLWLWLWALLWEAAAISFHGWCNRVTYIWGIVEHSMIGTPPLFDRLHESFPNLQWMRVVPEVGIISTVLFLAGLMLYNFDERSLDCFRTCLWTHGVILVARGLSYSFTLLPDASQECHTSQFIGGCHDLVFSGHCAVMTMAVAAAMHFYFLHPAARVILIINASVQSFLVAASRNHYTVDVIVAVVVALLAYVAFTRHPALVSLTTFVPAKVLSKPSMLTCGEARRRRRGHSRCCLFDPYDTDTGLRVGRDGYEIVPADSPDAPQFIAEHAHATLFVMGYRPRFVLRRRVTHAAARLGGAAAAQGRRCAVATPRARPVEPAIDERDVSEQQTRSKALRVRDVSERDVLEGEEEERAGAGESALRSAAVVMGDRSPIAVEGEDDASQWEWEEVLASRELVDGAESLPVASAR